MLQQRKKRSEVQYAVLDKPVVNKLSPFAHICDESAVVGELSPGVKDGNKHNVDLVIEQNKLRALEKKAAVTQASIAQVKEDIASKKKTSCFLL